MFGLALKRFNQIERFFFDFIDDQLDFHPYAIRKHTLRSYIDLVNSFRDLKGHKFFAKAAKAAIEIHLKLFECGPSAEVMIGGVCPGTTFSKIVDMSEHEKKKLKKQAKKSSELADSAKKEDMYGEKFVVGVDHLAEATKYLAPLMEFRPNDPETWTFALKLFFLKSNIN
jgi:peptide alpha-N-acetyltransferase